MIELFSDTDRDEMQIHLLETEPLFVALQDGMDKLDTLLVKHTTKVENWVDAKEFVANLFKSPVPSAMVNLEYKKLSDKSKAFSHNKRGCEPEYEWCDELYQSEARIEVEIVLIYSIFIIWYLKLTREEKEKFQDIQSRLECLRRDPFEDDPFHESQIELKEILLNMEFCTGDNIGKGTIPDVYDYTKPDGGIENTAEQPEEIAPAVDEQDISTPENNIELRTELTAAAVVLAVEEYKTASTERKKLLLSAISGLSPTTFNNVVSSLSERQKELAEKLLKEIIEEKK